MERERAKGRGLRRDHPVFFWGTTAIVLLLVAASAAVAARIPRYRGEAAAIDARMSATEKATRDEVLRSQAARSRLAVALLRREMRLKANEEEGLHLAVSLEDSTLSLRHGAATLRSVKVAVGGDSTVTAPDGRTWRMVRGLGERHVAEKRARPPLVIPEWVYVGAGEPVPAEAERTVEGGLGRYVLVLDDGTEIYSEPAAGPFRDAVKPAAFRAAERDLAAIFDAVREDTPVYLY